MNQEIVSALAIGLHHAQCAADWTHDAYRRAIQQGMYGTADRHHQKWQETKAAIEVIGAALIKAQQGHDEAKVLHDKARAVMPDEEQASRILVAGPSV